MEGASSCGHTEPATESLVEPPRSVSAPSKKGLGTSISFDSIVGNSTVKRTLFEHVVLPLKLSEEARSSLFGEELRHHDSGYCRLPPHGGRSASSDGCFIRCCNQTWFLARCSCMATARPLVPRGCLSVSMCDFANLWLHTTNKSPYSLHIVTYEGGIRSSGNNVLLHGPPGTGKTTIAQAASHEAGASFFSVTPSSVLSKYQGACAHQTTEHRGGSGGRGTITLISFTCDMFHQQSPPD